MYSALILAEDYKTLNIKMLLGWKSNEGRFDILPLVFQWGDEEPEFFELPDELVLRVPIRHPRYALFYYQIQCSL